MVSQLPGVPVLTFRMG